VNRDLLPLSSLTAATIRAWIIDDGTFPRMAFIPLTQPANQRAGVSAAYCPCLPQHCAAGRHQRAKPSVSHNFPIRWLCFDLFHPFALSSAL
jgi:hypothetical protein